MRLVNLAAIAAMAVACAQAHPAIGIVMDAAGAVYYSDTAQVWRIAPDGSKAVAVPNVHTHELWLDRDGNLYGIHEMGGGTWSHRVWKRSPDGHVADLIATRNGFLEDYKDFSLARDSTGAMYWLVRGKDGGVFKRAAGGQAQLLAKLTLDELGWPSVLPDGTVLVADHGSLIRIAPDGKVHSPSITVATNRERYSIMGAWSDKGGDIHVAVYGDSAIKRIARDGKVSTVAVSPAGWQPTGGLTAPDGTLWILETSTANAQRVRRVAADGTSRIF